MWCIGPQHPKQIHTYRLYIPGGLLALIRQQQQQATEELPNFWRELKVESRPGRSQDTLPSRLCRVLTEGTFAPEDDGTTLGNRQAAASFQICYLYESER
jgi:hypothetical protein